MIGGNMFNGARWNRSTGTTASNNAGFFDRLKDKFPRPPSRIEWVAMGAGSLTVAAAGAGLVDGVTSVFSPHVSIQTRDYVATCDDGGGNNGNASPEQFIAYGGPNGDTPVVEFVCPSGMEVRVGDPNGTEGTNEVAFRSQGGLFSGRLMAFVGTHINVTPDSTTPNVAVIEAGVSSWSAVPVPPEEPPKDPPQEDPENS